MRRSQSTKLLVRLVLGCVAIASAATYAGSVTNVRLTSVAVQNFGGSGGIAYIFFDSSNGGAAVHVNTPACATQWFRFVVDLGTSSGRASYSAALSAYLSGRVVTIGGTGDCGLWPDTESVWIIQNL